jgi:hypothetical protein
MDNVQTGYSPFLIGLLFAAFLLIQAYPQHPVSLDLADVRKSLHAREDIWQMRSRLEREGRDWYEPIRQVMRVYPGWWDTDVLARVTALRMR